MVNGLHDAILCSVQNLLNGKFQQRGHIQKKLTMKRDNDSCCHCFVSIIMFFSLLYSFSRIAGYVSREARFCFFVGDKGLEQILWLQAEIHIDWAFDITLLESWTLNIFIYRSIYGRKQYYIRFIGSPWTLNTTHHLPTWWSLSIYIHTHWIILLCIVHHKL